MVVVTSQWFVGAPFVGNSESIKFFFKKNGKLINHTYTYYFRKKIYPSMSFGIVPATPTRKWVSGARPLNAKFLIASVRLSRTMTSVDVKPFRPLRGSKCKVFGMLALALSSTKTLDSKALFLRSMMPSQSTSNMVFPSGNFKT